MNKKILGILVMTLLIATFVMPVTMTVANSSVDNPPVVVIESPPDGSTVYDPDITVTGYATDDIGLAFFARVHEWTGSQEAISCTLPPGVTYHEINEGITLHEGWNRITITVTDTDGNKASDAIDITYDTGEPPTKKLITQPRDGVYLFGLKIMGLTFPEPVAVVIGKITIKVDASTVANTDHVAFSVDDIKTGPVVRYTDYDEPYEWEWNDPAGLYVIGISVKDSSGNLLASDFVLVLLLRLF